MCFCWTAQSCDVKDLERPWTNSQCQECSMSYAELEGAALQGIDLRRADLKDADLARANLKGADFSLSTWTDGSQCNHGSIGVCRKK